jgi:adenylate cyclase
MKKIIPNSKINYVFAPLVVLLLLGLPIAVWLDLNKLVETNLRRQASDVNSIISSVRNYYANNVVGRVLASPGMTRVVHNYKDLPGAIPIPATLSLELGKVISEQQRNIEYRFVSTTLLKIAHHMHLMNSRLLRSVGCDKIQISG